jgi:hypothetical protein
MWKDKEEKIDLKNDGLTVLEENGGRGHVAPTPNELGKGQEE